MIYHFDGEKVPKLNFVDPKIILKSKLIKNDLKHHIKPILGECFKAAVTAESFHTRFVSNVKGKYFRLCYTESYPATVVPWGFV